MKTPLGILESESDSLEQLDHMAMRAASLIYYRKDARTAVVLKHLGGCTGAVTTRKLRELIRSYVDRSLEPPPRGQASLLISADMLTEMLKMFSGPLRRMEVVENPLPADARVESARVREDGVTIRLIVSSVQFKRVGAGELFPELPMPVARVVR